MREPRFKVGDLVTYKRHKDCKGGKYYFGGAEPKEGERQQAILDYLDFSESRGCCEIRVNHPKDSVYLMYEDEFEEFDLTPSEVSNYSIF